MKRVFITGMSGVGKSVVIEELIARGYEAHDADYGGLSELVNVPDDELTGVGSGRDWVWREDRIRALLSDEVADVLFLAGCAPNQGKFYPQFECVILLTAPPETISSRLASRTNNPFGKREGEVARTLEIKAEIEPLLERSADHVINTDAPLGNVVGEILRIAGSGRNTSAR